MKPTSSIIAILLGLCLLLTGCSGSNDGGKEKLHIVTSFYPVYIDAINIAKGIDGVTVKNMTAPQTGCLHDYTITSKDMKTLENADVFIQNGATMELNFSEKVAQTQKHLRFIDASAENIDIIKEGDELNPHVWLSVTAKMEQIKNITNQLKAIDPKHADAYQKNADAYIEKLKALKKEMHKALDDLPNRDILTFHEAFPYFAREFNLNIVGVIEREPGTNPSPAELKETIEQVNGLTAKVLFTEPQYSPSAAQTIARETGAQIFTLDPIVTGDADEKAMDAYIVTMRKNMDTVKKALGGK